MKLYVYSLRLTDDVDVFSINDLDAEDFVKTGDTWISESKHASIKEGPVVLDVGDVVAEMASTELREDAKRILYKAALGSGLTLPGDERRY